MSRPLPLGVPSISVALWQAQGNRQWNRYLAYIILILFKCGEHVVAFSEIEDPPTAFMKSNKCISPIILNGRSMAEMKTMGMLTQCRKSREKKIKEENEQVSSRVVQTRPYY